MLSPDDVWCFHHHIGGNIFSVNIKETRTWWTVTHLKHAIKVKLPNSLANIAADAVTLYRVAVDEPHNNTTLNNELIRLSQNLNECTELDEKQQLSVICAESPPPGKMYIMLVIPSRVVGIIRVYL
jgi:hypothetical protein